MNFCDDCRTNCCFLLMIEDEGERREKDRILHWPYKCLRTGHNMYIQYLRNDNSLKLNLVLFGVVYYHIQLVGKRWLVKKWFLQSRNVTLQTLGLGNGRGDVGVNEHSNQYYSIYIMYVTTRLGRKAKENQTSQLHPRQLSFSKEKRRAALGGIWTNNRPLSVRM